MKEKVKFILLGVKTDQFASFEESLSEGEKVSINTNLSFRLNKKDKRLGVFMTFVFHQNGETILKTEVSCHFKIAPESWNELLSDDTIVFPKDFMTHLTVITVGTARGILHAKTENTPFNKFVLPTIDVTQLVRKDVEIVLA